MKKGVLSGVLLLLLWTVSSSFAVIEKSLIDFNVFEDTMATVVQKDQEIHQQQVEIYPELDYSDYGYHEVKFQASDWHLTNWKVTLTSSSRMLKNRRLSYTKDVESKKFGKVLGVRVHFITGRFLSWALVQPPFQFFASYDDGSYVTMGESGEENSDDLIMGVLINVGQIKSVSTWVYGLNYKYQTSVRIRDRNDQIREYPMGAVYFDGWRNLKWINAEYSTDIRDRILEKLPLYPMAYPLIVFDSFVIYKPQSENGGDFVTYYKDVVIEYDRAIIREDMDINNEEVWHIISDQRREQRLRELKTLGEELHLERQSEKRTGLEGDTGVSGGGGGSTGTGTEESAAVAE